MLLDRSRWKTAATLGVALFLCLAAVPNLLPQNLFDRLPTWAQHKFELGYDLQGGSRLLLEVDAEVVRKEKVEQLREDVRKLLREGRVVLVSAPVIRGDTVEVRVREDGLPTALAKLRVLSEPVEATGTTAPDAAPAPALPAGTAVWTAGPAGMTFVPQVVMANEANLIRLTVTEAAIREQIQHGRRQSIDVAARRLQGLGVSRFSVRAQGVDRILIEMPGFDASSYRGLLW